MNKMISIADVPADVLGLISQHFELVDFKNTMLASKKWNEIFKTERLWESLAEKYAAMYRGKNPHKLAIYAAETSKSFIQKYIIESEEEKWARHFDCRFHKVFPLIFGSQASLLSFPITKKMPRSIFADDDFTAPVVIATSPKPRGYVCFLVRMRSNNTQKIYRIVVSVSGGHSNSVYFDYRINPPKIQKKVEKIVKSESRNWIIELLRGNSVGTFVNIDLRKNCLYELC